MTETTNSILGIIAGKGEYPILLAEAAKKHGVKKVCAVAFKKETSRNIEKFADTVEWLSIGSLSSLIKALKKHNVSRAVMAGQITPTHLFRIRMDREMIKLLTSLPARNAHSIFGAVADKLTENGISLTSASIFMEEHMAPEGVLTCREPGEDQWRDIRLGLTVSTATSNLEIGQTVIVKGGTIVAVEAFEGTNETIKRAARLAGKGTVIVKTAKKGHDMRFDIPVVGSTTIQMLKKYSASALALQAGKAIMLNRGDLISAADKAGIAIVSVKK